MTEICFDESLKREYVEQLANIDFENYHMPASNNALAIAEKCAKSYKILRAGNQVLGYTLLLKLNKPSFEALKEGKIEEEELTPNDVNNTNPAGIYISSIAASSKIKNKIPFLSGTLVGLVAGQVFEFGGEVIAMPVTRTGEKLARMLYMSPTGIIPSTDTKFEIKPQIWRRLK